MIIINDYFDELEFWDSCYFEAPEIKNDVLIIPAHNIRLYEEHPLNKTDKPILLRKANLVFNGTQRSERSVGEYIGKPSSGEGFKPTYTITDGPFPENNDATETFLLEGVLKQPLSYITWEIKGSSFQLEIEESFLNELP